MSEGPEHLLPRLNKVPAKQEVLPQELAERFITHTLGDGPPLKEMNNSSYWRVLDKEVEVPGLGKARLVVDYRRYHGKDSGQSGFEQILFDYYGAEADKEGNHPLIAEMHWFVRNLEDELPYDLALSHRNVKEPFRERGIGASLYNVAESWVRQVAHLKQQDLTLCIAAGQPDVMRFAEKRGYESYERDAALRKEVEQHPERFELKPDFTSLAGDRAPYAYRKTEDGLEEDPIRVWFRKVIPANES